MGYSAIRFQMSDEVKRLSNNDIDKLVISYHVKDLWTGISKLRTTKIAFPDHIIYSVFDKDYFLFSKKTLKLVGFYAKWPEKDKPTLMPL